MALPVYPNATNRSGCVLCRVVSILLHNYDPPLLLDNSETTMLTAFFLCCCPIRNKNWIICKNHLADKTSIRSASTLQKTCLLCKSPSTQWRQNQKLTKPVTKIILWTPTWHNMHSKQNIPWTCSCLPKAFQSEWSHALPSVQCLLPSYCIKRQDKEKKSSELKKKKRKSFPDDCTICMKLQWQNRHVWSVQCVIRLNFSRALSLDIDTKLKKSSQKKQERKIETAILRPGTELGLTGIMPILLFELPSQVIYWWC